MKMETELIKSYPDSFTDEEMDTAFNTEEIIQIFLDDEGMADEFKTTIIEDPNQRYKAALECAKKHDAQIYTEVDLDSGKCGYSKGVRFCNRINQGLYTVVKVEGLEIDNS